MNWGYKILIFISTIGLFSCDSNQVDITNSLVEVEQLIELIESDYSIKIIDLRKSEEFSKGHIPNAVNIWRPDIQSTNYPYSGIIAEKEKIERLFSKLGIEPKDLIIIYDDKANVDAARLWWILAYYGHQNIALLNGGYTAWLNDNQKVSVANHSQIQTNYKFEKDLNSSIYASKDDINKGLAKEDVIIVDTRTKDEFTGKRMKNGASRSGRIPHSIHLDWVNTVNYGGSKKFKSVSDLVILYKQNGLTPNKKIITYCHSGVRSAHTTFVLTQILGIENVFNYDGSWTEWSYYNELPIISDSINTIKD